MQAIPEISEIPSFAPDVVIALVVTFAVALIGTLIGVQFLIWGKKKLEEPVKYTDKIPEDSVGAIIQGPAKKEGERAGFGMKSTPDVETVIHRPDAKTNYNLMLEELVGIPGVKKSIRQTIDNMKFMKMREGQGLSGLHSSMHLVFTGNPGTGKTTVARIVGGILKENNYLKSGHVVEVSVPEMIGRWVGETPQKVQNVVNQALDGILFIDEAYALMGHNTVGGGSFGADAIATLLKMMEDHRERLAVIAAGYPLEMSKFLDSNPGFRSRFTEIIDFEDYSPRELEDIFCKMAKGNEYLLDAGAQKELSETMKISPPLFRKNFPNGRFVRNMFEDSVKNVGSRVANMPNPSKADLMTITRMDIQLAFKENRPKAGTAQRQGLRDKK